MSNNILVLFIISWRSSSFCAIIIWIKLLLIWLSFICCIIIDHVHSIVACSWVDCSTKLLLRIRAWIHANLRIILVIRLLLLSLVSRIIFIWLFLWIILSTCRLCNCLTTFVYLDHTATCFTLLNKFILRLYSWIRNSLSMLILRRQFAFDLKQLMISINWSIHSCNCLILLLDLNHLRTWSSLWWSLQLVHESIPIACFRSIFIFFTARIMACNCRYICFSFFSILALNICFKLVVFWL